MKLTGRQKAAFWFGYGFVFPLLPIVMVVVYTLAVGGLSLSRLGGQGQFLVACIGVSASIIAQVFAGGFPPARRFHKIAAIFFALVLVAVASGFFGAVALSGGPSDPATAEGIARVSLVILLMAGITGLFAAPL